MQYIDIRYTSFYGIGYSLYKSLINRHDIWGGEYVSLGILNKPDDYLDGTITLRDE